MAQQEAEPTDEAAEVVAGGGEDGVGGVSLPEPEIVAAHAVLGLEMADDGFDGSPAAQFALDLGRHPSLLAGDEDPELVIGRRVVVAVSLVGGYARNGVANHGFHARDSFRSRGRIASLSPRQSKASESQIKFARNPDPKAPFPAKTSYGKMRFLDSKSTAWDFFTDD
ncbi:hypothetical protein ACVWZ6_002572 [Bradyrhizobium sp. GM6.1]